jgi:hypothetical protein
VSATWAAVVIIVVAMAAALVVDRVWTRRDLVAAELAELAPDLSSMPDNRAALVELRTVVGGELAEISEEAAALADSVAALMTDAHALSPRWMIDDLVVALATSYGALVRAQQIASRMREEVAPDGRA